MWTELCGSIGSPEQRDQGLNDFMASLRKQSSNTTRMPFVASSSLRFAFQGKTDAWWLNNFCVHPERQRQGIGRRLLEIVRQKAKARSQVVALSATRDVNAPVYKAYGFEQKGVKKMLSPWGDWPLYVFVLDAGCQ
ncbi:uncharacterized protein B0H18DRAFT_986596 [Fomitopsis serialis]|uniref:uncharacterized protein n=1 Tax=Fomitopsis serialis TaxID=139415 RepID=UPI002008D044|nr:uncharacterized protein B0H18DRAFT_986596 [Neoantrodia serialis]KAH9932612.1 hypothetical protein B0H18DRAFT_986596 [Neoantrodia serialis]